jgi:hypothetical protein
MGRIARNTSGAQLSLVGRDLKAEIAALLRAAPRGLSEDGLAAGLALRQVIRAETAILTALLDGSTDAVYDGPRDANGDPTRMYDPAAYSFEWRS